MVCIQVLFIPSEGMFRTAVHIFCSHRCIHTCAICAMEEVAADTDAITRKCCGASGMQTARKSANVSAHVAWKRKRLASASKRVLMTDA